MTNTKAIEALIDKAVNSAKSDDALRFSQAACNAANALNCLCNIQHQQS